MAYTHCIKCQNTIFELKESSPKGSEYKIFFVQCSSCGTPTGVLDYFSAGVLLKKQDEEIKKIKNQLNQQSDLLSQIATTLNKILKKQ